MQCGSNITRGSGDSFCASFSLSGLHGLCILFLMFADLLSDILLLYVFSEENKLWLSFFLIFLKV